jgi:ribonuclease Z
MTIQVQILGKPGWDNSAFVKIDTGKSIFRFAFDAGDACLSEIPFADLKTIDTLFLSHLHIDHFAGIDTFIRANYCRDTLVPIYGPENTSTICEKRFKGFTWNLLNEQSPGGFEVHDVLIDKTVTSSFYTKDIFDNKGCNSECSFNGTLIDNEYICIESKILDHKTPSLAFLIREKDRVNLNLDTMRDLGLPQGAWCRIVKDNSIPENNKVVINGAEYDTGYLRDRLLCKTPGESVAYLTDYLLDANTHELLQDWLQGCTTLISECMYCNEDRVLAALHHHVTSSQIGKLANDAKVKDLILFHVSDRYDGNQKRMLLDEVRAIYPDAHFPLNWSEYYKL